MGKNKIFIFTFLSLLICILSACGSKPINITKNQGKFDSSKSDSIIIK